jgi:hypothetical protein
MTDDFTLFPSSAGADRDADHDVALITAYLARELSPVQIAAVQDRIDADPAFRSSVAPVIEAWVLPAGLREGVARRLEPHGPTGARTDIRRPPRPVSARSTGQSRRWSRIARIAAVIVAVLFPMIAVAQVTIYLADHPDAPGHRIARRITDALRRRPPVVLPPATETASVDVRPVLPQPAPAVRAPADRPVGRALRAVAPPQQQDTVVRRATAPVHQGIAGVRRETSIGVADGEEPYVLGAIADVAVSARGEIYVWDRSVPAIRMYDAAGKFLRNIGRMGSGPGEYRSGAGIAIAKNGNLLMWDPGNARINVYSPAGEPAGTVPTLSGASGTMLGRDLLTVDTAGVMSIYTILVDRTRRGTGSGAGWIRFNPDGSVKDTLRPPSPLQGLEAVAQGGGQFASRNVPFSPVMQSAISPLGYLVSGLTDRIAIDLHLPRQLVSIRRDAAGPPVTAAERDSARDKITSDLRKVQPNWSWNGPAIPRTKPVYSDLLVDGEGRLWVQVGEGPRPPNDTSTWRRGDIFFAEGRGTGPRAPSPAWSCPASGWTLFDVYEPSGRYLGQVKLPERADPIVMRGDYVWAATCNADDVPSVVRYRIEWGFGR